MVQVIIKAVNNQYFVYLDSFKEEIKNELIKRLKACSREGQVQFSAFFCLSFTPSAVHLIELFDICKNSGTILMGIKQTAKENINEIVIMEKDLSGGQTYYFKENVILLGNIEKDCYVVSEANLFVLGYIRGNVDMLYKECVLYSAFLDNASIRIHVSTYQIMTNSASCKVYYSDRKLILKQNKEAFLWGKQ